MEILKKGKYTYYIYEDFVYILMKHRNHRHYLKCNRFRNKYQGWKCDANLVWDSRDTFADLTSPHNHEMEDRLPDIRFRTAIVKLLEESNSPTNAISMAKSLYPETAKLISKKNVRFKRFSKMAYRFKIKSKASITCDNKKDTKAKENLLEKCEKSNSAVEEKKILTKNEEETRNNFENEKEEENEQKNGFINCDNIDKSPRIVQVTEEPEDLEDAEEISNYLQGSARTRGTKKQMQLSEHQTSADSLQNSCLEDFHAYNNFEYADEFICPEATLIFQNLCLIEYLRQNG